MDNRKPMTESTAKIMMKSKESLWKLNLPDFFGNRISRIN